MNSTSGSRMMGGGVGLFVVSERGVTCRLREGGWNVHVAVAGYWEVRSVGVREERAIGKGRR